MAFPEAHPSAQAALEAASREQDEQIHAQLQEMLRTGSNPNTALADGLNLVQRYYLGPLVLNLEDVPRCCGPEPEMTYYDPQPNWDAHIQKMADSIVAGWEPAPLLFAAGGHLMDGNHRHGALTTAGKTQWPVLVMFDSAQARSVWVEQNLPVEEVPLTGGHISKGLVRSGATVRRPTKQTEGLWRPLLKWLEETGYTQAPRYLGVDEHGRDVLTWIDGF